MAAIHTTVVGDAHAYTRSRSPWIMSEHHSVSGRLIHYLAGGGMRAFGRTVRQEEVLMRRRRFLAVAATIAAAWLAFLVI